jgi:hypothetical protein
MRTPHNKTVEEIKMSNKKKPDTKTIEISTDFYDVLCRYKKQIRKIVHKPISHEKVIKLAFCFKNIDTQLSEIMAEGF